MTKDMEPDRIASRAPASWIEAVEQGRADVAAGRTVSADEVHARFRERLARHAADALANKQGATLDH